VAGCVAWVGLVTALPLAAMAAWNALGDRVALGGAADSSERLPAPGSKRRAGGGELAPMGSGGRLVPVPPDSAVCALQRRMLANRGRNGGRRLPWSGC
jgi:hypothetical protein